MKPIQMKRFLWVALALGLVVVRTAVAATVTFSVTVDGQAKTVTVDAFQADGQAYVSIEKFVRQLGGATSEAPGKATVDLAGRSAVLALNGTRVSTSQATFDLAFAVKEADGGPYIAVADLAKLFGEGLGTPVAEGTAPAAQAENRDLDAGMDLLDEVATPAADAPAVPEAAAVPPTTATPGGGFTVVLDPGHGGSDPGVVSAGGTNEKDVALRLALALQESLKGNSAIQVTLTRTEDKDLTALERANLVNQAKAQLLISLHTGASTIPGAHGFELFVPAGGSSTGGGQTSSLSAESTAIGKMAEEALLKATGGTSRGVRTAPLRMLGDLAIPGVLVELGVLTNPAEENLLASADHMAKLVAGLSDAIQRAAERAKGGQ